jgi:hypothetical protein
VDERREAVDPDGRRVAFDAGSYLHLARRRPALLDHLDSILATVQSPDLHVLDPIPGRERYYYRRHFDGSRWLRVVVDFSHDPGWIVTVAVQTNDPRRHG